MSEQAREATETETHEPTDNQHLVLLPTSPRKRQHPHDDAAEFFFNHVSDPETGMREMTPSHRRGSRTAPALTPGLRFRGPFQ